MLQIASNICPPAFYESLLVFTEKALHEDLLHVLARLYYMLSGDAAMSSVVPFDSHKLLERCCNSACRKMFPKMSRSGFGYLFLWFCPIHGHSYGFHVISGGEGRKDPFCSLYKYFQIMPKHIYYDFACQLSEYCLNREPDLFKNTRFWHDLFHFIGHLCGINFKSGRILGLEGVNTETCEQVNSFLQCIKYTGSHLSQDHFTFFLQFFLYLMNKDKTKSFQKLAGIAIAGQL